MRIRRAGRWDSLSDYRIEYRVSSFGETRRGELARLGLGMIDNERIRDGEDVAKVRRKPEVAGIRQTPTGAHRCPQVARVERMEARGRLEVIGWVKRSRGRNTKRGGCLSAWRSDKRATNQSTRCRPFRACWSQEYGGRLIRGNGFWRGDRCWIELGNVRI